jgi:hypothetical protein
LPEPVPSATLADLDRYFDAAPRSDASAEAVGPFTLFKPAPGSSYYARPRLALSDVIDESDVAALERRCHELDLPMAIEWIGEITPSLEAPARDPRQAPRGPSARFQMAASAA